ncbi:hypothetical protein HOG48_06245 [Candidatus Peregrinibacteria bacterium]|jgi:hypothetical protein|nr:hypothetical protein [Candidatus Peregrinibacteria bacterium]
MALKQALGFALALGLAACSPADVDNPNDARTEEIQVADANSTEPEQVSEEIMATAPDTKEICRERARRAVAEVREAFSTLDISTSSIDLAPLRAGMRVERDCLEEHGVEIPERETLTSPTPGGGSLTIIL